MNAQAKRSTLVTLGSTLLAACVSSTEPIASRALRDDTYYIGKNPVQVEVDDLHRYACADRTPLMCQCPASRISQRCTCSCRL